MPESEPRPALPPCTASIDRAAAERPGYSPTPAWITVHVDGVSYRLLLDVASGGSVGQANAIAQLVVDGVRGLSLDLASLRADHSRLCHAHEATTAAERSARQRLAEALTGRTMRLNGRARVVVEAGGACWLQDPEKGDSGFGLRFPSLAHLWREMPSLRPVLWGTETLIVESLAMEVTDAR